MRLIDADIAINMISDEIVTDTKVLDVFRALGNMNEVETLNTACERHIHMIEQLPTVDAVEVVRCRDCVCCDRDNGSPWCGLNGLPTDFDEYCSEGERRTDE